MAFSKMWDQVLAYDQLSWEKCDASNTLTKDIDVILENKICFTENNDDPI